jgi:hypothetical protein
VVEPGPGSTARADYQSTGAAYAYGTEHLGDSHIAGDLRRWHPRGGHPRLRDDTAGPMAAAYLAVHSRAYFRTLGDNHNFDHNMYTEYSWEVGNIPAFY